MLHGIFEQDQIHHWIDIIVLIKSLLESLAKCFRASELIVKLVINACNELSENKGLRVLFLEELTQVCFCVSLFAVVVHKISVHRKVSSIDETISVNTFELMDPQLYHVVVILDRLWFSLENALEDISQVTHIEFVVEVNGRLLKLFFDERVHGEG